MFSSYDGAKRLAKKLQIALAEIRILYPLHRCQSAVAVAGGYADWHALAKAAPSELQPANPSLFSKRLIDSLPDVCRTPASVMLGGPAPPEWHDKFGVVTGGWFKCVLLYVVSMSAVHRRHTALIRPGSGEGQKLRQDLLFDFLLNPHGSDGYCWLDAETLALKAEGNASNLFFTQRAHPNFYKEFHRLLDAGIFQWNGDLRTGGVLTVFPPTRQIILDHARMVERMRSEERREKTYRAANGRWASRNATASS